MLPMTLGRDLSGTVESAGAAVGAFSDGDILYAMLGSIDRGSYAEHVLVRPNEASAKPARLSHIEAAAVPLAALTAWQGLFDHGHLEAGQTVLIHGGSGGVGHFAIQFAKVRGATVLTTVSAQNLDFVGELGADRGIDYDSQRFEEIAGDVDLVLDLVLGATQERSWPVLKPGGILVSALGEPSRERAMQHRARVSATEPNPMRDNSPKSVGSLTKAKSIPSSWRPIRSLKRARPMSVSSAAMCAARSCSS
jgi:NADPH:quinone reductase-like Zn-dependent oxidoreductase